MNLKLADEESKIVYDARINYMKDQDYYKYWDSIKKINRDWYPMEPDVVEKIREAYNTNREIILYGCGKDGFFSKESLELLGIKINYFCDSYSKDAIKYGISVIAPIDLVENHADALVIISTENYTAVIMDYLLEQGFNKEAIITPMWGKVLLVPGEQYFDYFKPATTEVFVDAGAYDGQTTIKFKEWSGNSYKGAILFEPFEEAKPLIDNNIKQIDNIEVYYNAVWDKREDLFLDGDQPRTTSISDSGRKIAGITIDEVVNNREVTFIKMDVEGSEYKALLGAKNTITKQKPRLAICVYHKPEDIVEIPELISSFVPEYKYALRHYTSCMSETVLYAWVDEN